MTRENSGATPAQAYQHSLLDRRHRDVETDALLLDAQVFTEKRVDLLHRSSYRPLREGARHDGKHRRQEIAAQRPHHGGVPRTCATLSTWNAGLMALEHRTAVTWDPALPEGCISTHIRSPAPCPHHPRGTHPATSATGVPRETGTKAHEDHPPRPPDPVGHHAQHSVGPPLDPQQVARYQTRVRHRPAFSRGVTGAGTSEIPSPTLPR